MATRTVDKTFTFEQQRVEINEIGADNGDFSGKVIAQSVANNLVAQTITDCLIELDTELGPIASITNEIPANDKDNVVEAVNYFTDTIIKALSNLTTTDKTSIVNALNEIIVEQNNGVLDKRFQLYWPRYENSFILTTNPGYKVVALKFFTRISF